jgi:hypothetical protein
MVAFIFIGLGFFAAQIVVSWFASNDIANTFIHTVAGHKNPDDFAQKVIDASGTAKWATGLLIPAVVGMIAAIVYTALQATRAGLLTRFWGTLGMALGATMLLIPPLALFALVLWVGWLSLLIGGWLRSGRPPAWAAGEAIPWLKPGEEPEPAAAPTGGAEEAGGNGVVEGEARPVPSERGERRKRKKRQ